MDAPTNTRIGDRLGLAHSTVSRMRRGDRIGSTATLRTIATLTGESLEAVTAAADLARSKADLAPWRDLLDRVGRSE